LFLHGGFDDQVCHTSGPFFSLLYKYQHSHLALKRVSLLFAGQQTYEIVRPIRQRTDTRPNRFPARPPVRDCWPR
jgi:hypothetical protein